ncbi:hypothetical protein OSH41_24470 [Mycobacterium ulcerans]|nr:hypothetical protein A3649_13640 [Mycobacterium ulcerans]
MLPVPPLSVPDTSHLPGLQDLARCDAEALFVKHARASQRSFKLTERNAAAVAHICAQLDGLPLAIELAAPLLRTMAVEQIAARVFGPGGALDPWQARGAGSPAHVELVHQLEL